MKVVVYGATSAIAQEAARVWAARGAELVLYARNEARLRAVADDLRARGATAREVVGDLDRAVPVETGDVVLLAFGVLEGAPEAVLHTNLTAQVLLLEALAPQMARGSCIAVIGSVAGDRGRAKNPVYGASKAGIAAYCSGLRQKLVGAGVRVLLIKPGTVDTPMTASQPKGPLFASAREVGAGVVRAVDRGRETVYLPGYWRAIMFVVRALPELVFKKTKF